MGTPLGFHSLPLHFHLPQTQQPLHQALLERLVQNLPEFGRIIGC